MGSSAGGQQRELSGPRASTQKRLHTGPQTEGHFSHRGTRITQACWEILWYSTVGEVPIKEVGTRALAGDSMLWQARHQLPQL